MFSACSSCMGHSTRADVSSDDDSAAMDIHGNHQEENGDSIFMELSVKRFSVPVDTIVSAKIINKTDNSYISIKGGLVVEKKIDGKWIPFEHREKSKSGAVYAVSLLAINIGKGGDYDIKIPLRSEHYAKEFSPGEYRLGKEIQINGMEKRYVYSGFTVY